jgi:iron complex outermembrane receptor protein
MGIIRKYNCRRQPLGLPFVLVKVYLNHIVVPTMCGSVLSIFTCAENSGLQLTSKNLPFMKCITATLTMALSLYASMLQAQQVNGTVKDDKETIAAATVSLLNASDSSWVQSELTDDNGAFVFRNMNEGKYLLNVAMVGYDKYLQPLTQAKDIAITLVRNSTQLNEVVVKSTAPTIQTSLGKMTVNFEQSSIPAGNSILELLRKAPGVIVDGRGNISMNGKGVLVMINGKQTYLAGDDLFNYLKSLPAEEVAQFDLMTQPSAKYDAEGNAGIINIKLRKNKKAGLSGNVALSASDNTYLFTRNSGNVNYRKNKLSLYANASQLHGTGNMRQHVDRKAVDQQTQAVNQYTEQSSFQKETFGDNSMKVGGDYELNDKVSMGASIKGIYHPNSQRDLSNNTMYDYENNTIVDNTAENQRGFWRKNLNSNVNISYKPAKDQEITVDVDNLMLAQKDYQKLDSKNYDEQGVQLPTGLLLRSQFPLSMNVTVGKADYTNKLNDKWNLEVGMKSSYVKNEAGSFYDIYKNDTWQNDETRTNNFIYKENINAAYVSADRQLGKKWQAKAGLRMENANIEGLQEVTGQSFNRSLTSLFPTAFVGYKLDEKNSFELNAGRRIQRPSYRSLNPFAYYLSQYTYTSGNANLMPEFRNFVEAKHNYKNILFSEVSYARVYNTINTGAIIYDAVTRALQNTYGNGGSKTNMHCAVSYSQEVAEWWTLSGSYEWYHNDYQDTNGNSIAISDGHAVSVANQFSYKGWSVDTLYAYNSGDLQSVTERNKPSHWTEASVAKKIWKDTATIKLSAEDPFHLYQYAAVQNGAGIVNSSVNQFATRQFVLGFTYNFGQKQEVKQHNSNVEESKRM